MEERRCERNLAEHSRGRDQIVGLSMYRSIILKWGLEKYVRHHFRCHKGKVVLDRLCDYQLFDQKFVSFSFLVSYHSTKCACCLPFRVACDLINTFFVCADCFPRLLMVALQGSLVCHVCSLWIWWRHDCRISRLGQMACASTILCEFVIVAILKGIL